MRKKKQEPPPLPAMLVGDDEPADARPLADPKEKLALMLPDAANPVAGRAEPRTMERAEAGTAAPDDSGTSLAGCMAYVAMCLSIMAMSDRLELPQPWGTVIILLGPLVTLAVYLWNNRDDSDT